MKFTEEQLERAVIELLGAQSCPRVPGATRVREPSDVLIAEDLHDFLSCRYRAGALSRPRSTR